MWKYFPHFWRPFVRGGCWYPCLWPRPLHSPSLVAPGLSVGYETWNSISQHHTFVIGQSKYRLGLPRVSLHCGLMWPMGISTVFQTPLTVPLHSPNGRQMPIDRAVQGNYSKESTCGRQWVHDSVIKMETFSALLDFCAVNSPVTHYDITVMCLFAQPMPWPLETWRCNEPGHEQCL